MYGLGLKFAPSASGQDGLLDICLFERGSAFHMLKYFAQVLSGRHRNRRDIHLLQARRVRIESDQPVPIQVDGDPAGTTPADVRIVPQALELLLPLTGGEGFVE
jgi:diacylglycerol kinase family enzyme